MSPDNIKLADASSLAYGTCPEGFPLPLRASTCALTSSGSSRKVGGNQDVAARHDACDHFGGEARVSVGMPSLPAGTEVRAGQPAPPTTTEQSRERTPAGSSNMEVAA